MGLVVGDVDVDVDVEVRGSRSRFEVEDGPEWDSARPYRWCMGDWGVGGGSFCL